MTSLLVIIDNQYCLSHTIDTNTGTITVTNINIPSAIINDEQKAGTSHDYNGLSAYNRLRHSERQRRRYKQMLQQKQKQPLQIYRSDGSNIDNKFFDNLRRPLSANNNNNNNSNNNGVIRNKLKAHHR
ncbi:unnamed protein product, partial [Acanthocheilonema viteae]